MRSIGKSVLPGLIRKLPSVDRLEVESVEVVVEEETVDGINFAPVCRKPREE